MRRSLNPVGVQLRLADQATEVGVCDFDGNLLAAGTYRISGLPFYSVSSSYSLIRIRNEKEQGLRLVRDQIMFRLEKE